MSSRLRIVAFAMSVLLVVAMPALSQEGGSGGGEVVTGYGRVDSTVFDRERNRVYIQDSGPLAVGVYDNATGSILPPVSLSGADEVGEMTINTSRDMLYVVLNQYPQSVLADAVVEIDLDTLTVLRRLEAEDLGLRKVWDVHGVGNQLFVSGTTNFSDSESRLTAVNLVGDPTPAIVANEEIVGRDVYFAEDRAVSQPTDRLYVVGRDSQPFRFTVVTVFDTGNPADPLLRRAGLGFLGDVIISPDGSRLLSRASPTFFTVDLSDGPSLPEGSKWPSSDGRYVYTGYGTPETIATLTRTDLSGEELPITTRIDCPGGYVADLQIADSTVVASVDYSVCVFPLPQSPATGLSDLDAQTTERIDYDDPTTFATAVSQLRYPDGSAIRPDHAVLSRDDTFADSLAGAVLTGEGPLLFTGTDALSDATLAELRRLLEPGGLVYVLGGSAAISSAVEETLATQFTVRRLAGVDRIRTSIAIAREALDDSGGAQHLLVVRADAPEGNPTAAWADSIAAGAVAARHGSPIVLNPTLSLDPDVDAFLRSRSDFVGTLVVGGSQAISHETQELISRIAPSFYNGRTQGSNRAGTATQLAIDAIRQSPHIAPRRVAVFNGYVENGWAFGLAGAGAAADLGSPLVLVSDTVPPETAAYMGCSAEVETLLLGGREQISDDVATALAMVECS